MEAVIGNLTKEEFFGTGPNYSKNIHPSFNQNSIKVGKIVGWMAIGGIIVYIFRKDIETLFLRLFDKSPDKSK